MDVLTIAFMSLQGMNDGTKMVMDASGNGAGEADEEAGRAIK